MVGFKEDECIRDVEYGIDSYDLEEFSEEFSNDELTEMINTESQCIEARIIKDIDNAEYLSKKEKAAFKRIISKKINHIIKIHKEEAKSIFNMDGNIDTFSISNELDENLMKVRDSANELLDIDDYGYDYINNVYPKNEYYCNTIKTENKKDYSLGIKEIDSDRKLKIKIDKDSLDMFLSESDGDNENIGIITGNDREFNNIENTIFKIVKINDNIKKRSGAYTEADGKAISDFANTNNIIKCGWIHTHPFTKNSTFFSSLDKTTTKEMCVFPDDFCLAVVVGCEYKEINNFMKDDGKIIKEYDLAYNLGKITYRKIQLSEESYNGETDSITKTNKFVMAKYECEILVVDKNGNIIEEM